MQMTFENQMLYCHSLEVSVVYSMYCIFQAVFYVGMLGDVYTA